MKRGQAGPASGLLALIAVFIILYLLLIPPELRNELLGEPGKSNGKKPHDEQPLPNNFNRTILTVTPGRLDFLRFKEYEHPLPAVNLFSTKSANEMEIGDSVYVKNGIFDKQGANLTFRVEDEDIQNAMLSFSISPNRNNAGRLIVHLNGKQIYNKQTSTMAAPIGVSNLQSRNTLSFEVTGVGWRFWTTNEYELDDIKLFYDSIDTSTQKSKNTFMITDSEKFNLERVSLKFFPDCNPNAVGRLSAVLNSQSVFNAVPDCGQLNLVEVSPGVLQAGMNKLEFESDSGKYLIDQVQVKTELQSMIFPVYFFDMPDFLFSKTLDDDEDEECGDIDGICPKGCDTDLDKDCCLKETSNYWCDYQPSNQDDRCTAVRRESECGLCKSGYEDDRGDPPEECEDRCGDDTDNDCPSGCSRFYDEDCCFDDDEDNFWCDDIPKYGLATCKEAITKDECDACPDGWESDESDFKCTQSTDDVELKSRYDIEMTLKFVDDRELKAGKVFINGYQFHFQTYDDEYKRNINTYMEDGTNSVKIEPDRTVLDIRELLIEVDD